MIFIYSFSQEDPYKLTVLAKDAQQVCVTSADFFFANQQLSIVTCDEEGILRMYHYNPHGKSTTLTDEHIADDCGTQILNRKMASAFSAMQSSMAK